MVFIRQQHNDNGKIKQWEIDDINTFHYQEWLESFK